MTKGEKKKMEVYNFIRDFMEDQGVPPTTREIGDGVGLKSTSTVFMYIKKLEADGLLGGSSGRKRGAMPTEKREPSAYIPMLGTVTAGQPILAIESHEETVPVDPSFVRGRELFALKIKGDSMINAGILDKDTVFVERTPDARNGEIVVALIEDEATVKRFYKKENAFWLMPENDAYQPIIVEEVVILGKVVGLFRDFI